MPHLYVHVPFCRRRCVYCDFAIAVRRTIPGERFVDAILREAALRGTPEPDVESATLYFGGGTPSLLAPHQLARLIDAFAPAPRAEVTLEANPDDVTGENARGWANAGINRVSLGVQSFDDGVLRWMHRTHTAADARNAVATARDAGIENVSLDLIFGLPAALGCDWERDVEMALECAPDHVSVYGLTVEARTPLRRWVERGSIPAVDEGRYEREYLLAHEELEAAGFDHYEISNYARPDRRAVHNGVYWSGAPYVGLGPSAHSFDGETRRWNVRDWARYETIVCGDADPVENAEHLTPAQQRLERVLLGLRTVAGVEAASSGSFPSWLREAVAAGWVQAHDGSLRLTPVGWLRIDELLPRLTTFLEGG